MPAESDRQDSQAGVPGAEARSRLTEATTTQPAAVLPQVSYPDLVLLVKAARRAFREQIDNLPERGPSYRPPALKGLKAVIHLTLRAHGAVRAEVETRRLDMVDAAVVAGTMLGQQVLNKKLNLPHSGDDLGLEFEMLGPPDYLDSPYDPGGIWSKFLLHSFEPAVEGIGVEFRGRRAWTRPSEVIIHNYTPDLTLQAAESAIGLEHAHKLRFPQEIRYFRFRAYHLWQPAAHLLPVLLLRGATLVSPESLGPEVLDEAIRRMGTYLRHRQKNDGWFSHVFLPTLDRYGEGNSARVQLHAIHGLAAYGAWSGEDDAVADTARAIRAAGQFLKPISGGEPADQAKSESPEASLALRIPGHGDHLEISARLLLALAEAGSDSRSGPRPSGSGAAQNEPGEREAALKEWFGGLTNGLLDSQVSDGRLHMAFQPPPEGEPEKVAAAGWALLALARADPSMTDPRIERALHRALSHYRTRPEIQEDPLAAAALSRAFAQGYAWTNDARASSFVFDLLDRLARLQVTAEACPWPELHGAFNVRQPGAIGVDTATYLLALTDGLALAQRVGDQRRILRYRRAVLGAVRFILQLEFREEGCYYVRSPQDAWGGVRAAPWVNRIRADHCAEALMSLMRARHVLYGRPSRWPAPREQSRARQQAVGAHCRTCGNAVDLPSDRRTNLRENCPPDSAIPRIAFAFPPRMGTPALATVSGVPSPARTMKNAVCRGRTDRR
jgi:hypothetical protein